jgi:hypothetical protein
MATTTPAIQAVALMRDGHMQAALLYAIARDGALTLFDLGARGVTPEAQRDDGIELIAHLLAGRPGAAVRAVNIAAGEPLQDALSALGCPVVMRQDEMLLDLSAPAQRG